MEKSTDGLRVTVDYASAWKGLRMTVQLTIQNQQAAVSVVHSASSLVVQALKGTLYVMEKSTGDCVNFPKSTSCLSLWFPLLLLRVLSSAGGHSKVGYVLLPLVFMLMACLILKSLRHGVIVRI
jgi:hypothetical protein